MGGYNSSADLVVAKSRALRAPTLDSLFCFRTMAISSTPAAAARSPQSISYPHCKILLLIGGCVHASERHSGAVHARCRSTSESVLVQVIGSSFVKENGGKEVFGVMLGAGFT